MASASEATHAINFPAVMAIVAGIVADPKRYGVGVDQVSAVEPAGSNACATVSKSVCRLFSKSVCRLSRDVLTAPPAAFDQI